MASNQMNLPDHAEPRDLEYFPNGEDEPPWKVGDWRGLHDAFSKLRQSEVLDWHATLASQGRPWDVVRRMFRVAPVYGVGFTEDDLNVWTWESLSKLLAVPVSKLKEDLAAAVEFWKKQKNAAAISEKIRGDVGRDGDVDSVVPGLPDFTPHGELSDEQIESILTPFRFNDIKREADRFYVAHRVLELRAQLMEKATRESARQFIHMELSLETYQASMLAFKRRIDFLREKEKDLTPDESNELVSLVKSLNSTEESMTKLAENHMKMAKFLGADEMEQTEQKRIQLGTIGWMVDRHREFYATGSRKPVDGIFTAAELVWLTESLTIRPPQYRPDIVIRANECLKPENLWDKDYKPSKVEREAVRRLTMIVNGLSDEKEPEEIPAIDVEGSPEEGEMDESGVVREVKRDETVTIPPPKPVVYVREEEGGMVMG